MTEIRTVTTLQSKRAKIIGAIANYEKRIAQPRAHSTRVNACIAMFLATGAAQNMQPYVCTNTEVDYQNSEIAASSNTSAIRARLARPIPSGKESRSKNRASAISRSASRGPV
jgi:hypothetical protein